MSRVAASMGIALRHGFAGAIAFLLGCSMAAAQQCNCSVHLGQCQASGKIVGQQIRVTSNTAQCSQIVFSIDGQPGSITITGGSGAEDYLATRQGSRAFGIHSCTICQTAGAAPSNAAPDPQRRAHCDRLCGRLAGEIVTECIGRGGDQAATMACSSAGRPRVQACLAQCLK